MGSARRRCRAATTTSRPRLRARRRRIADRSRPPPPTGIAPRNAHLEAPRAVSTRDPRPRRDPERASPTAPRIAAASHRARRETPRGRSRASRGRRDALASGGEGCPFASSRETRDEAGSESSFPPKRPRAEDSRRASDARNEAAWVFDPILAHTVAREEVQHDVERGEGVPAGAPDRRRGGVVSVRRRPRRFRRRARLPLERFSGTSSSLASTPSSPLTFIPTASSSSPFPLLPRLASASKATTARSPSASAAPSAG